MKAKLGSFLVVAVVAAFMGVGFTELAVAQVGFIWGEVVDGQGNPLPDVQIRIEGMNNPRKYRLKTDKKGEFVHAGIAIQGLYRVIAEKEGYSSTYLENIRPGGSRSDERGQVNFTLTAGGPSVLAFDLTDEERAELQRKQEEAKKKAASLEQIRGKFNEAITYVNNGQYDEAVTAFKACIEIDPEQAVVWGNLGSTYSRMGRNEEALEAYDKAIALDPDDSAYLQNKGSVLAALGRIDEANAMYEQAAQKASATSPKDAAMNYYNMGVTYINVGKNEEAANALKRAIEIDPTYSEAHYQLGLTYLGMGDMEASLAELKKYLEIAPNGPNADTAKMLIEQLGG
jgi:tetratricopeptide (TPR) repeat protein